MKKRSKKFFLFSHPTHIHICEKREEERNFPTRERARGKFSMKLMCFARVYECGKPKMSFSHAQPQIDKNTFFSSEAVIFAVNKTSRKAISDMNKKVFFSLLSTAQLCSTTLLLLLSSRRDSMRNGGEDGKKTKDEIFKRNFFFYAKKLRYRMNGLK